MLVLEVALGDAESDILTAADKMFTYIYKAAISLFKQNPKEWAESMGIWGTISAITDNIVPIACSIVVLLFLIGFCANTIDVKEDLNFERCIRLLIRLGITEWFVLNSYTIAGYLFQFASGLVGLVDAGDIGITAIISEHLYEMSDISRVVFLFPCLFYLVILVVSAGAIFTVALMRMFRVLVLLPYGPLAYATIASGVQVVSGTLPAYIKQLLGTLLQAFSIMVGLRLGQMLIINKKLFDLTTLVTTDHLIPAILALCQAMLSAILLLMLVQQSKDVASKALALTQ